MEDKIYLNIAVFTDYYLPTLGGIQTSVKAQKEALEELGHKVTIFCPGHLPSDDNSVVRIPTFKRIKPDGYPLAGTTKKVISCARFEVGRRKDIDVIHVHSDMVTGVVGLVIAKEFGIPSVQTMHGREDIYAAKVLPLPFLSSSILTTLHSRYIPHGARIDSTGAQSQTVVARRMWRLMVAHANFANSVIVPSRHFAKKLQHYGVVRPVSIVSNGLEKTVLRKIGRPIMRQYDGVEALKIMWCGRVSPEKRPIEFLESIKLATPNTVVDMYGEGVYLKRVRKYIKINQLEDRITAHGPVSQDIILQEMSRHHILAYSSFDFDNQPMVLLEAITTGLPVLYCDPDLGETIPAEGSILSDDQNPSAMAASINRLVSHPKKIRAMSAAMLSKRDTTLQSRQTKKLISVYRETIRNQQFLNIS